MHYDSWRQAPPQEYIAYTARRSGGYDVWLVNPHSGSNMRLTNGLGDSYSSPEWSKDNTKIAFVGKNRIVYVLYLTTRKIAAIDQLNENDVISLQWSPNNRILTYTVRSQIVLYDVMNHKAQSINEPTASYPQFFPNGNELLYQANDTNGMSQLYQISINGTNKAQITNNSEGPLHDVKLSPDGQFVLYTTPGASISLIRTIELKSGTVFEIEGGPLAKNYYPTWSPDSKTIAYSATVQNQGYSNQIRIVGRRGYNDRIISHSTCFATPVTWSSSGVRIAYLSGCTEEQTAQEMWVIDTNSRVPRKIVEGMTITNLQWSKPSNIHGGRARFTNQLYHVSFQYPANWQQVSDLRYEGKDGFFQIAAISGTNIEDICQGEAFHQLRPYGSNPQIFRVTIQNQGACLIFPSQDQPTEMNQQAAIIVEYPTPIEIEGTYYNYLIIWANRQQINNIAFTLRFI